MIIPDVPRVQQTAEIPAGVVKELLEYGEALMLSYDYEGTAHVHFHVRV